jgi:hypothetical protein
MEAFMNKAAQLAKSLEGVGVPQGMKLIEKSYEGALHFDLIADAMCVMHDDGSVSIFQGVGHGSITGEVISAVNILKVLQHYRPFKEVFKDNVQ